MDFSALIVIIATLFLLLICGFIARKLKIIDDTSSKNLSTLIIKIGQPMMIISALAESEFSYDKLADAGRIILIGFALHAFMALVAYLVCKGFPVLDERKIAEFSLLFTNVGFIGFPIMEALFGPEGLFLASFYVISFHIFIWTWGIAILARQRDDIKLTVKKVFINFGTVPCFIGAIIYLLVIPFPNFVMPEFILKFLKYLSNLCTPISVLITGALLANRSPRQILDNLKPVQIIGKKVLIMPLPITMLVKLIVMPLVVCVLLALTPLDNQTVLFCTAMAALPSAATITMLSEMYSLDSEFAAQTVGVSSLLCVATIPLILMVAEKIVAWI